MFLLEPRPRVWVMQGATWRKEYCPTCAKKSFDAPDDTEELLETETLPNYPPALREFTHATKALPFDAKMAAAGGREPGEEG